MKILAVEHAVPSRKLTNDEVRARVLSASAATLDSRGLERTDAYLQNLFRSTGIRSRHVTDGADRPIDLVSDAARRALERAEVMAKDLDFIIFGGVSRSQLVPSSASAVQYALGASGVSCFDVLDACASWARALQIAGSFIAGGTARTGLIVNSECGFFDLEGAWTITKPENIELECGTYTIGEAATATVVTEGEGAGAPEFHAQSYGEYGDLAVLPIHASKGYTPHRRQPDGTLRFFVRTQELTLNGLRLAVKFMKEREVLKGRKVDAFVPHAGAAPSVDTFLKLTKFDPGSLVMSYREYGNTVSASIPLGLSLATDDGRIQRGDLIFVSTVAAGLSIVAALFTY